MNNLEGTDRLSGLPDDLNHKILSFLDITEAIDTSMLSPRWRYIWTSMPCLNFSTEDLTTSPKFSKFVTQVLSRHNSLTQVYSVKLSFRCSVSQVVKRILRYAISHNVQQLSMVCFPEKDFNFPLSLVSSRSLKHLILTANNSYRNCRRCFRSYSITQTLTWELPALTTLELHSVALCNDEAEKCVGIFSKCANLKNLTLKNFTTRKSNGFSICHPRLSNLTLEDDRYSVKVVKVVAPQLENLTIRSCHAEYVISAPDLASLFYKGNDPLHLSTDSFHSLEKADICVTYVRDASVHQIAYLLQQLYNVHFLTLNLEIVEHLSSSGELVLHQPSPFVNLKRLKIYPYEKYWPGRSPKKEGMSAELKSYLLDGSPECTVTMISYEEITANNLMVELRGLLRKEKDNIKTNIARVEWGRQPKKLKIEGDMVRIKGHWENLAVQIQERKTAACLIISMLQSVKDLLTKLPAANSVQRRTLLLVK